MNRPKKPRKNAFTLVELLVVIAIIALLISLLLPALGKAIRSSKSLKDATQVKQIHTAMLNFASNNKGRFPTPGLINRLADVSPGGLGESPNQGKEDTRKNRTNFFYSAMIAQDFVPTALLVGPTEVVNPIVQECKDYNHDAYAPGQDRYWDGDIPNAPTSGGIQADTQQPAAPGGTTGTHFSAAIHGTAVGNLRCHTSYAHMAITGQRKKDKWKDTGSAVDPVVGTRGCGKTIGVDHVKAGDAEYDRSPTLALHDPQRQWDGNVVFNDNHGERLDSFYATMTNYESADENIKKDDIFCAEFKGTGSQGDINSHHGEGDAFLTIYTTGPALPGTGGGGTPVPVNGIVCRWDALLP